MKTKFLLFCCIIATFAVNAQFTFQSEDGTTYESGDVYLTNSIIFDESSLDYRLFNSTDQEIHMRAEIVSIVGNDGGDYEFCLGLCYFGVSEGQFFPPNGETLPIDANGNIGPGNHIWYGGPDVDPEIITELTVRYFQTNEAGDTQIGDDLIFIYRYDPDALGVNDVESTTAGVQLNATVLNDVLNFTAAVNGSVSLYDIQGRKVLEQTYNSGSQSISVAALPSQIYVATFTTMEGRSQTVKLVKR